jgi:hypothetical protein
MDTAGITEIETTIADTIIHDYWRKVILSKLSVISMFF